VADTGSTPVIALGQLPWSLSPATGCALPVEEAGLTVPASSLQITPKVRSNAADAPVQELITDNFKGNLGRR
jgi:hypothetical protein